MEELPGYEFGNYLKTCVHDGSGVMSGTGSDFKFFQKLDLRELGKFR